METQRPHPNDTSATPEPAAPKPRKLVDNYALGLRRLSNAELAEEIEYIARCSAELRARLDAGEDVLGADRLLSWSAMDIEALMAEVKRRLPIAPGLLARRRITAEFAADLKRRVELHALLEWHSSPGLRRSGNGYSARCPWHADRTPSLHVWPDEQRWWCFGACNQGGDVFDWLKMSGLTFRESVETVAHFLGVPLPKAKRGAA